MEESSLDRKSEDFCLEDLEETFERDLKKFKRES